MKKMTLTIHIQVFVCPKVFMCLYKIPRSEVDRLCNYIFSITIDCQTFLLWLNLAGDCITPARYKHSNCSKSLPVLGIVMFEKWGHCLFFLYDSVYVAISLCVFIKFA